MTSSPQVVTDWLIAWSDGDEAALDQLIPLVHEELRRLAKGYMRRARAQNYAKRGGGLPQISLDDAPELAAARSPDLVSLDDALEALSRVDERKGRVVELRF